MPNRDQKESALTSATLYRLSDGGERLFWRLILVADDFGRFEADPQILKSRCFPRWPDQKMSPRRVLSLYAELELAELVQTYVVSGVVYGHFVTWEKHQRIRAKFSKYPSPASDNICRHPLANVPEVRSSSEEPVTTDSRLSGRTAPAPQAPSPARHAPADANGHDPEPARPPVVFKIPASVVEALDRSPILGAVRKFREPLWWQAEVRANRGVDFGAEVLKAEAWMRSNPSRAPKSDHVRFLHSWLRRADRDGEEGS